MKKKTMRLIALLLALMMALSLAACGGDDPVDEADPDSDGSSLSGTPADDDASGGEVGGGTDGFGDFVSILVPDEFRFERDSWNEENPHFVSVKRSDFAYFDFRNFTDEAELMQEYDYNKRTYTNEQEDVSANYGGIDWTGFQYGDGFGGYGFEAYAIINGNYLKVASGGFAFDNEISAAILGSVVMVEAVSEPAESDDSAPVEDSSTPAEADDSVDAAVVPSTDDEVIGDEALVGADWLDYWVGDWYGWWLLTDGTGIYAELYDGAGQGVWDACASIEAYEDMTGYLSLWDSDGSSTELIAGFDVCFANPDDTALGVMGCNGGQFLSDMVEEGAWYVNPDELAYENIFDFSGEYEDEDGTFSYRVVLRPWGTIWDDLSEDVYPEFYYDWYLPLVEAGEAMPDHIG